MIEYLDQTFCRLEIKVIKLSRFIQVNYRSLNESLTVKLSFDAKNIKINKHRTELILETERRMRDELKRVRLDEGKRGCERLYLSHAPIFMYSSPHHLQSLHFFGSLVNLNWTAQLNSLKFTQYSIFIRNFNSRQTPRLPNTNLELVDFMFVNGDTYLISYKKPQVKQLCFAIYNSLMVELYNLTFSMTSIKSFKLKIIDEQIYLLIRYVKESIDYVLYVLDIRMKVNKLFKVSHHLQTIVYKIIAESDLKNYFLFTFHVNQNELVLSLKKRLKDEFHHLIWNMSANQRLQLTGIVTNSSRDLTSCDIETVLLDKHVSTLIAFNKELMFFVGKKNCYLSILVRKTGAMFDLKQRVDSSDVDFHFDFENNLLALLYRVKSKSEKKCMIKRRRVAGEENGRVKLEVYDFNSKLLGHNYLYLGKQDHKRSFFELVLETGIAKKVSYRHSNLNT